ncbi:MAG: hypothetical protein IH942_07170 [Acidobacteria bacterium]|nr:hypothetical protein [Acidobacteriota bacterium]
MQPQPVADSIVCVECGAKAHLLTRFPPDDPPRPGDVVAYVCEDCGHRFDIVHDDVDELEEPGFDW